MTFIQRHFRAIFGVITTSVLLLSLYSPGTANAFSEDLCPANQGGWRSCIERACTPQGENMFCESATMLSQYVTLATGEVTGVRSVLHFDSLYLLAQAVGLSAMEAYQLATYNQAVDTGKYDHRDEQGNIMVDRSSCGDPAQASPQCTLNSADLSGVGRNNFAGGGLFFHFHTVPPATRTKDGLNPDVIDPMAEPFLNHLRTWAHGKGPLCLGGLSFVGGNQDIDSGSACYKSPTRNESTLLGRIPFITELGEWAQLDWISTIDEQKVIKNSQTGEVTYASALEQNLPKDVPADMVRMGIYLHALQDRISHHRCITASNLEGPRPADAPPIFTNAIVKSIYDLSIYRDPAQMLRNALSYPVMTNPEFFFEFSRMECDQTTHFQRHSFEVGIDQESLDARDRTTEAGLRKAYTELALFVKEFKKTRMKVPTSQMESFMADLVSAIEEPDPTLRIQKISEVAPKYKLIPLPGHLGLSADEWLAQASNTNVDPNETGGDGNNNPNNQSSGGGGSFNLAGLLILGFLLRIFKAKGQAIEDHSLIA